MSWILDKHTLGNGMVVLGEPMEAVESAAFSIMIPAGAARLPDGCCGAGGVILDWIFRGAGKYSSRQLSDALDGLGVHRNGTVGTSYITLGAALEASNLSRALELYADIICNAHLKDDQFDLARSLTMEEVKSLDDDPRQKVMLNLREQFFAHPLGRSTVGVLSELEKLDADQVRSLVRDHFDISNTIFSVAGKYDFDAVCTQLEDSFGLCNTGSAQEIILGSSGSKYTHLPNNGAQVHIGLVTPTITPDHPDYYAMRVAIGILSGGMSSRLFNEVREKRGLCYAVGARYHGLKQAAGILCYAGTTPDKAQETARVIIEQFKGLSSDLTEQELHRAQVGLKSSLIMQSESSSSRAGSLGGDFYMYGRVRSLDEIKKGIDDVTIDSIKSFINANEFNDFTAVTIGPESIEI